MNHNLELLKIRLLQLMECKTEAEMVGRINGLHWAGYTMVGLRRLDNLEFCINEVVRKSIPGAIVEAGVWKGGACIFATAALKELKEERNVYVCDIFDGTFPKPKIEMDEWTEKHDFQPLVCKLKDVQANFRKFGYLDSNVIFKEGWFENTLPTITEPISILRVDGDTYQSTMNTLQLEKQLSPGGYIIMDDWAIATSRQAFIDYFEGQNREDDVIPVDSLSVYWQKNK